MTSKELENKFGKCISDKELSKYFGIDVRTLRKYASSLKGVMVLPGRYMFFENLLREIIENAELNNKEWYQKVSGQRANTLANRKKETETISRCQQKIVQRGGPLGRRNKGKVESGDDPHGIFNSENMG